MREKWHNTNKQNVEKQNNAQTLNMIGLPFDAMQ
jgi:hypothetical protein